MLRFLKFIYRASNAIILSLRLGVKYARNANLSYDKNSIRNGFYLLKVSHSVEKGLSARNFDSTRGHSAVKLLKSTLNYSPPGWENQVAQHVLELRNTSDKLDCAVDGSFRENDNCHSILQTRRSHRSFKHSTIDDATFNKLYELIRFSPTSCNRQPAKLHIFRNKGTIDKYLKIQTGNNTFRHELHNLAIVAFDYRAYQSYAELDLGIVDASILGTFFLLALEELGLGGVPLNWAATSKMDKAAHQLGHIAPTEKIVLFIGFGIPVDKPKFAISPRRHQPELIKYHE